MLSSFILKANAYFTFQLPKRKFYDLLRLHIMEGFCAMSNQIPQLQFQ